MTSSGPYRLTRHPLYAGSSLMGVGLAIASARWAVAVLVAVYLVATLTAAIRSEEAFLRSAFGDAYDRYREGRLPAASRRFSWRRARANREYRAVARACRGDAVPGVEGLGATLTGLRAYEEIARLQASDFGLQEDLAEMLFLEPAAWSLEPDFLHTP